MSENANGFTFRNIMASSSCPVELRLVQNLDVVSGPFVNTHTLEWMHELPPRFGKSDEINDFLQRQPEAPTTITYATIQQSQHEVSIGREYAIGVLGLPIAIGGFFLLWMLIILGCSVAGPRRVGIFSGRRVLPSLPIESKKEIKKREDEMLFEALQHSNQSHLEAPQQQQEENRDLQRLEQQNHKEHSQEKSITAIEQRLDQRRVPRDENSIASMKDISDDEDSYHVRYSATSLLGQLPSDESKASNPHDMSPYAVYYNTHNSQQPHTPERQLTKSKEDNDGNEASPRFQNYRLNLSSRLSQEYLEAREREGTERWTKMAAYDPKDPSTPTTPNTHTTSGSTGTDTTSSSNRGHQSRPYLPTNFDSDSSHQSSPGRSLSLSHYESEAVARKRVIEEYVKSRSTKVMYNDFWAPEEYAKVISPPPYMEEQKVPEGEDLQAKPRSAVGHQRDTSTFAKPQNAKTLSNTTRKVRFDEDSEQTLVKWKQAIDDSNKRVGRMHIVIIAAAFCAVSAAMLYSIGGMEVLLTSINDGRHSLDEMQLKIQELLDIFEEISEQQDLARNASVTLSDQVNQNYCPNLASSPSGELCPSIANATHCQEVLTEVPNSEEVKVMMQQFAGGEAKLDDLFPTLWEQEMGRDLVGLQNWMAQLKFHVDYAPWILWSAAALTDLLALLCLFILCGVIWIYTQRQLPRSYICLRRRVIMPLFVLLLTFEVVVVFGWVTTSTLSADFCVDSPESRLQILLERNYNQHQEAFITKGETIQAFNSSIVYSLANYYTSGCQSNDFPSIFDDRVGKLATSFASVSRLEAILSNTDQSALEATCGTIDFDGIQNSISIASLVLCLVTQSLVRR